MNMSGKWTMSHGSELRVAAGALDQTGRQAGRQAPSHSLIRIFRSNRQLFEILPTKSQQVPTHLTVQESGVSGNGPSAGDVILAASCFCPVVLLSPDQDGADSDGSPRDPDILTGNLHQTRANEDDVCRQHNSR